MTTLDEKKNTSNRLVSISGKYRTIITAKGEKLDFEGKREWNKWIKNNDYLPDF